jgi:hypothetical protein
MAPDDAGDGLTERKPLNKLASTTRTSSTTPRVTVTHATGTRTTSAVYPTSAVMRTQRTERPTTGSGVTAAGARLVLVVGARASDPRTGRLLTEHADRLEINVQGEPFGVRRWVEAWREPGRLPWGA